MLVCIVLLCCVFIHSSIVDTHDIVSSCLHYIIVLHTVCAYVIFERHPSENNNVMHNHTYMYPTQRCYMVLYALPYTVPYFHVT